MPVLAGWLTGEQVSATTIEQTLAIMETVLTRHGGQIARIVQSGMGLVTFANTAHAMQHNDELPILDWVSDRRTFVYRRPLSGEHALYYLEDWPAQGNLLFASELKALLALGIPRELRFASLNTLLRFGFIPAPWTAFKHISVVPAGSILRWQHAKTVVNHTTDFRFDSPTSTRFSANEHVEQLGALLTTHTLALLPLHEKLAALTDGSTASALPALIASRQTETPFTLVSFGYKNYRSKVWQGVRTLAEMCQRPLLTIAGVDQPDFWVATLAALESPCVDTRPLALHQLLHSVAVETQAQVALSGLGAGTLLTSYEQRTTVPDETIFSHDTQQKIQQEGQWEETLHARKLQRRTDQFTDVRQKHYYRALHLLLPDSVVSVAQQLAMQEGIAIRSPYLRGKVIEMLTSLHEDARSEMLLAQLVKTYLPTRKGTQARMPLAIPVPSLLHSESTALLKETLAPEAIEATGIFDAERVAKLLQQKDVSRELLLVFTTQLFCRLFDVTVS